MAATPPPVSLRAHTPPTPLHGPRYDNYEPYSPRRSKRSTALSNPYSSFNGERTSPKTRHSPTYALTPPATTQKKTRFARTATQLSSPPSSPEVPIKQTPARNRQTPRKALFSAAKANGISSDSDGSSRSRRLSAPSADPAAMFPTPSKTPRKHKVHVHTTSRVLNFQPNHPNDVMPTPRKLKHAKQSSRQHNGFALFDEDVSATVDQIDIYTDANARVPEMDQSEENPFVGPRRQARQPRSSGRRRDQARMAREQAMMEAAARDEGVIYQFRGRKIFKRFETPNDDNADAGEAITDLDDLSDQQSILRKAGPAAQRPLTRSSLKPKLLFPSNDQRVEREGLTDEEAVTDIEMPNAPSPTKSKLDLTTPHKGRFIDHQLTPPPSHLTKHSTIYPTINIATPLVEDEDEGEPMSIESSETRQVKKGKGKTRSPFEEWALAKPDSARATSRKRSGEPVEESSLGVKKTRSTAASPA